MTYAQFQQSEPENYKTQKDKMNETACGSGLVGDREGLEETGSVEEYRPYRDSHIRLCGLWEGSVPEYIS